MDNLIICVMIVSLENLIISVMFVSLENLIICVMFVSLDADNDQIVTSVAIISVTFPR